MENINWYPGHMKKTRELIAENLRLVGAVVEVCDARIPVSSRNPILKELTSGRPRVLALNKSDLADERATRAWCGAMKPDAALALNSVSGEGVKHLLSVLARIEKERTKQGRLRIMIVGVPNVGKSSLINRLAGRKAAMTGDRPGVTKGKQWLTLENGMQLLDTPGILWPKFEDPDVGRNLAFCGSIRDEILDVPDLALELLRVLVSRYRDVLTARYGLEPDDTQWFTPEGERAEGLADTEEALAYMDAVARRRGCILPGKRIDYERVGRLLLDEFRAGRIGRITLEAAHGRED
ncbi:MAG: ribosome biogenesis GTPase YlqF [Clostridiales Family XIII bacterium]|jgi:ribosome biogenesis GTPase A|nr:ribosome biogenesis GTPase YlqF [Clostridiales Family XIII bacterium]